MARFDDAYTPYTAPIVDERTQLAAKGIIPKPSTATSVDPYYVRDPKTGLSPAQVDAQNAIKEAAAANTQLGIPSVVTTKPGSAGSISTPPTTGLKAGYEWYAFNLPGGGFEWRQKPTKETLVKAYGGGGSGGGGTADTTAAAALAAQQAAQLAAEEKRRAGQSAYALLFAEFERYGLGALVEPLKGFITEGLSPAEFTLRLRDTDAYRKRFAANAQRTARGLRALSEAEYIELEDQYQNIMRQYGLPESYYTRGELGRQQGFEKFIAGDVSAAELEDRISTAQNRVLNAAPEVAQSLREFYPDITNGDILAYALDPEQALSNIKRKVTAAEIGAGARQAGLGTGVARAEELARYGVTGAQAREGFQAVAGITPRASMLADIYSKQELGPYTQTTAEQEVFGLAGATEAQRKRQKLTQLEQAQFAGSSGAASSALSRERAGSF